jgi:hypothetical protein
MRMKRETLLTHHHASGTHHFTQHICFLSLNKKELKREEKVLCDYFEAASEREEKQLKI